VARTNLPHCHGSERVDDRHGKQYFRLGQADGSHFSRSAGEAVAAKRHDPLAIIVAPVILGGGKALFDGFTKSLDLDHIGVHQMEWATLIEFRVKN
jgi:hypothetical protein